MVLVLGHSGRPMVISSGMQSMDTMKQVYQIVKPLNPNFCFLQCTSAYPLSPEDVNLRIITVSKPLSDWAFSWVIYCGKEGAFVVTKILTHLDMLRVI